MVTAHSYLGRTSQGGANLDLAAGTVYTREITLPAGSALLSIDAILRLSSATIPGVRAGVFDASDLVVFAGQDSSNSVEYNTTYRSVVFPVGLVAEADTVYRIGIQEFETGAAELAYDTTGGAGETNTAMTDGAGTGNTHDYSIAASILTDVTITRYGASSLGASLETNNAVDMWGSPVVLPSDAFVVSMDVGVKAASGTQGCTLRAMLCADNGGAPGQAIMPWTNGLTSTGMTISTTARWVTIPVLQYLTAGTYWVMSGQATGAGGPSLVYDAGSSGDGYRVDGLTNFVVYEPTHPSITLAAESKQYSVRLNTIEAETAITGTGTSTLDDVTSAGAGTFTPAAITGTGSSTLDNVTSSGTGVYTPPAITGTGASTLAPVTSVGTGTYTPPGITGTGASTLDNVVSDGDGFFIAPITGTGASTLDDVTSVGVGSLTVAGQIGTVVCGSISPVAVCGSVGPAASCSSTGPNATCRIE